MSLKEKIKPVSQLKQVPKLLSYGATQTGKTHDAGFMPGPALVLDADKGVAAFHDRFPANFDQAPVNSFDELVAALKDFVTDPWFRKYKSLIIDGFTILWDREVHDLGLDQSSEGQSSSTREGKIATQKAHADLARRSKEVGLALRLLTDVDTVVLATAEERRKFRGMDLSDENSEARAGVSMRKFGHLFDFIYRKVSQTEIEVEKSRYESLKRGQKVADFTFKDHVLPIANGQVARSAAYRGFEAATAAHEELWDLLVAIGTVERGGKIPREEAQVYRNTAFDKSLDEPAVRKVINEVKEKYSAAVAAA